MNVKEQLITPDIARNYLEINTCNRTLNGSYVARLASEMSKGLWKTNGATIVFSNKRLLDGQHRLHAIILSAVSIVMTVAQGVDDDAFDTIDKGKKRSHADTFSAMGELSCKKLAASLAFVDRYNNGNARRTKSYTTHEMELLLSANPQIRDSVSIMSGDKIKRLIPESIACGLHYIFSRISKPHCEEFFDKLSTGIGLNDESAIYLLRDRLILNLSSKEKLQPYYISSITIKAWNYYRQNKVVKCLRFIEEGRAEEQYPKAL